MRSSPVPPTTSEPTGRSPLDLLSASAYAFTVACFFLSLVSISEGLMTFHFSGIHIVLHLQPDTVDVPKGMEAEKIKYEMEMKRWPPKPDPKFEDVLLVLMPVLGSLGLFISLVRFARGAPPSAQSRGPTHHKYVGLVVAGMNYIIPALLFLLMLKYMVTGFELERSLNKNRVRKFTFEKTAWFHFATVVSGSIVFLAWYRSRESVGDSPNAGGVGQGYLFMEILSRHRTQPRRHHDCQ